VTDLACGKVCWRCNHLVNKVTGVRHGDFCLCISGYRNPRIWILALQRQAPPLFLPSYSRKIKWGTALYCLNGFNFHILYLPKLKPGSDLYIPLQDNAGSRCDDLPCRLFPQMGGWIRPRSTYGRPHLIRHLCDSPHLYFTVFTQPSSLSRENLVQYVLLDSSLRLTNDRIVFVL
jgi:hypothetical protein